MMREEIPPEFWQGIEQFNQQEYYACHDTLEALWMEAMEPTKKFYQGILQIAVGLYHLSNHNWQGTVTSMGEGMRRLDYFKPDYFEINVEQLIHQTTHLLLALQAAGPEQVADFIFAENGGENILKITPPKIFKIER
jgi:predicted metal-dependent hydrolase